MGLIRLNIKHLIIVGKGKLYQHLFLAHNVFLCSVLSVFLLHNSDIDPMLKTVFWTASVAVDYCKTLNVSVPFISRISQAKQNRKI